MTGDNPDFPIPILIGDLIAGKNQIKGRFVCSDSTGTADTSNGEISCQKYFQARSLLQKNLSL